MPKIYVVHKPTHRFLDRDGKLLAVGQMRGDLLLLNRFDGNGSVTENTWAVGSCAYLMTGHGEGVASDNALKREYMESAWRFMFGADVSTPAACETA